MSLNPGSEHSSPGASRNSSISGPVRQTVSKPKHNVKFTPDSKDESPAPAHRHSLPAIHLPDSSDLGDALLTPERPLPTRNLEEWNSRNEAAAQNAHSNANKLATRVKRHNTSQPQSRRPSFSEAPTLTGSPSCGSPSQKPAQSKALDDIPLQNLTNSAVKDFVSVDDSTDTDEESEDGNRKIMLSPDHDNPFREKAKQLVRTFTGGNNLLVPNNTDNPGHSGTQTPANEQISHEYDYVPKPDQYQPSVLQMLLSTRFGSQPPPTLQDARQQQADYLAAKLAPFQDPQTDPRKQQLDFFGREQREGNSETPSGVQSPQEGSSKTSGLNTPRSKRPKWYKSELASPSTTSVTGLLASASLTATSMGAPEASMQQSRPPLHSRYSAGTLDGAIDIIRHPISSIRNASRVIQARRPSETQVHALEDRLSSQQYLLHMCRALMCVGAPTHRLEEAMTMAARKLRIEASFQYLPGCMIVSFDDPVTHTSEIRLVKEAPMVDLGKMKDIQEVYKEVIHDKYSIGEAMDDIQSILARPRKFNRPTCIFLYGVSAVAVGPFAFSARPIDFPIAFILGSVLGALQLGMAARSSQFSHLFEVVGTCVISFAARGFGSILHNGAPLFCFSSLAQSSIALILPGWLVMCAALELQSRNIVAGSIRMVYAIIYTLFLGFGLLLGVTIMGLIYSDATNEITCGIPSYWDATDSTWRLLYTKFVWVPIFTVCLAMINQAKWKQLPWMIFISAAGYQVNYWSGIRFSNNVQVSNALGAFTIGLMANLYSRFHHGVAAVAMLPAIFVQVPSGLAASGSLVAALTSAEQITHNSTMTGTSIINNGTQGFYDAQTSSHSTDVGTILSVAFGMVQVAIGISVGLFLSALVIYPFGKKRSGLFTF